MWRKLIETVKVTNARHPPAFAYLRPGVAFVVLFFLLQIGWQCLRGSSVEHSIIYYGTARPAAFLINLLTPSLHARAFNSDLTAIGGELRILNGCEGMDALLLLLSAFAVAPLSWSAKIRGVLIGALLVFAVNQARILILFYVARADRNLFEQIHATAAPIAVILAVSGYFYVWLYHSNRRAADTV
jgi:exosortase/archaeosortase family protein